MMRHDTVFSWVGKAVLIIAAILFFSPFVIVIIDSVKTQGEVIENPFSLPLELHFGNFPHAWESIRLGGAMANTAVTTAFGWLLLVYLSASISFWCVRHPTRYSRIFEKALLCSVLIPFSSIMLPVVKLLSMADLTGTLYGGIIAYCGMGMAFSYFVMRGAMKSLPKELEEAAMIDGCTIYRTFFSIIFPLTVPTAVSVLILEAFWIWNDYNIAVILLNSRTTKTIQVAIHALFAQTYSQWDIALPALVISMMPIIVMNILLQKKIFAGMTAGAIKG